MMSIRKVGLIFILIFWDIICSQTSNYLNDCLTSFVPSFGNIIICDNKCERCHIICSLPSQCKNIKIYSSAQYTSIYCNGNYACQNSEIHIGNINDIYLPNNYNQMRFNRDKYKDINIECNGMESCSKITFYINGNFIGNNNINADSDGKFSLKDGLIDVSLMENQIFNINCGNSNKNCEGTSYICKGGLCYCNNIFRNVMDGCSSFKNYVINSLVFI